MKNRHSIVMALIVLSSFGCQQTKKQDVPLQPQEKIDVKTGDNTLTSQEKIDGWQLLFDGQKIDQWHKYNGTTVNKNWTIADNAIHFNPDFADGGDLTSNLAYTNFELTLDWKIQECGNSGIMLNVNESYDYQHPWLTGPEMQVLDDSCHPDGKIQKHRAGDLYDLIECTQKTVKAAGEWNSIKIVSNNAKYEFWQNEIKVVSFEMHTPEWKAMVASSKFKDMPDFGKYRKGKIVLQDHADRVWYKNIKIKTL